jgi:biotin operon repressor
MSDDKEIVTKHDLLVSLQQHIGRNNGVKASALAAALNIPPRQVRTLVTELRMDGYAVCGIPGEGYYIAATAKEIQDTCDFLHSRGISSLTLESVMRKCTVPELSGQQRLES